MYNPITFMELVFWFFFAATEFTMYANSTPKCRITILTELFTLAGFEMTAAAEAVGFIACFILRLFFGSSILVAVIVILTVQLTVSTMILKHFIALD